ncbi:MAG: hypothetical protein IKF19_04055 [Bacilli bacterium]|nr:hypothetical protein [Bacilli bacterium]
MRKRRVLRILSIVLLVSLFLVPIAFAIYRYGIAGDSSLSTAGWQVSINQQNENDHLSVISGQSGSTASYAVNITSNSEVDAVYSIVVNGIPTGVSVVLDGETVGNVVNNKAIFSDVGTILYNDSNKTKRHTLTFSAANNATIANNQSIDINVIARQLV